MTIATIKDLRQGNFIQICKFSISGHVFKLLQSESELLMEMPTRLGKIVFRLVSFARKKWTPRITHPSADTAVLRTRSILGEYKVAVRLHSDDEVHVECTVEMVPENNIREYPLFPDVLILDTEGNSPLAFKEVTLMQKQLRTGACMVEFTDEIGSIFYLQDLSRLSDLAQDTQSSLADSVRVDWPEIGIRLNTGPEGSLKNGKPDTVSHFHLILDSGSVLGAGDTSCRYITYLEKVYKKLFRPKTSLANFFALAENCLTTLSTHHGCWQQVESISFLNAYLNDYGNPPESMVQLAVLSSLNDFGKRFSSKRASEISDQLIWGLPCFFNEKTGCLERWIPQKSLQLDGSEEQKKPRVMDSWYLHYPLMQLALLMENGLEDDGLREIFYRSLSFCIKVAKRFRYKWPVFYDLDTLKKLKSETSPGQGGEKDVGGLYAALTLKAFRLSGDERYLKEAENSCEPLVEMGTSLIYQSNNTALAAEAMLDLWDLKGERKYLELCKQCLENLLRNTGLWARRYGNSKEVPTFFSVFPLTDAPYSAIFEEQECLQIFHRILKKSYSRNRCIGIGLEMLLCEYIHYCVDRIPYYYPPNLPVDVLSKDPRTGYIDPLGWIPVEDIGDGWDPIGTVGQEVYGLGSIFQVATSLSLNLLVEGHFLLLDYPFVELERSNSVIRLAILGVAGYEFQFRHYGLGSSRYQVRFQDGAELIVGGRIRRHSAMSGQEMFSELIK